MRSRWGRKARQRTRRRFPRRIHHTQRFKKAQQVMMTTSVYTAQCAVHSVQKDSSHSAFGKSTSDDDDICAGERFITLSLRKTMLALFLFRPLSVSMMVMMMNDHIFDEVFSFFKTCLILSFFSGMYLDHQHPPLPQIALLLNLFDRMLYDQMGEDV